MKIQYKKTTAHALNLKHYIRSNKIIKMKMHKSKW